VNKYHVLALCISIHALNGMENKNELQFKAAMGALSQIAFKGDEKVLDIGCGDGRITAEIAKRVPRGSVKSLLDISNMQYPYKEVGGDGFHYEYNVITAFASLSCIKDQKQVFKDIARLLAYKGKVRTVLAHKDCSYVRARTTMLTHERWKGYFVGYEIPYYPSNEQEVQTWLNAAGLKEEYVNNSAGVRKIEVPHTFNDRKAFIEWIGAIPLQIDRIPEKKREQFFNDIIDEYLKLVPQKEDGSIEIRVSVLDVRAERASGYC
jgi:trans-aconitate 2-methyltransferase